MSQLLLFTPPADAKPDARHAWARRSTFPGRADEWRCIDCGELAIRSIGGGWAFLSPDRGPNQWGTESHAFESRVWQ